MARIVVQNGKVCTSGGRVITDAGGAPCACDPGSNLTFATACSFPAIPEAIWITDAAIAAVDPADGVVLYNGQCYQIQGRAPVLGLVVDTLDGSVGDCLDPLCVPPPTCPPPCIMVNIEGTTPAPLCDYLEGSSPRSVGTQGGAGVNGLFSLPWIGGARYADYFPCSVRVTLTDSFGDEFTTNYDQIMIWADGECVDGRLQIRELFGLLIEENDGGARADVSFGIPSPFGHPVPPDGEYFIEGSPYDNVLSVGEWCTTDFPPERLYQFYGYPAMIGGTIRWFTPAQCVQPPVQYIAQNCDNPGDTIEVDINGIPQDARTALVGTTRYGLTSAYVVDGTPTDVVWSPDDCPPPPLDDFRLAYPCEIDEPAEAISVDFGASPPGAVTATYQGKRYVPSSVPTQDPPVVVVWSTDPCPDPQKDRYIAEPCDPRFPQVAYQTSAGMQPGEGIIWDVVATPSANFPDCLQSRKYRCTDQSAPPELRLASESQRAGACGQGIDFAQRDCTNIGDDDPVPQTPRGTGLGDITARAINIATLGRVKPCGACERRRHALNEIGRKMGL